MLYLNHLFIARARRRLADRDDFFQTGCCMTGTNTTQHCCGCCAHTPGGAWTWTRVVGSSSSLSINSVSSSSVSFACVEAADLRSISHLSNCTMCIGVLGSLDDLRRAFCIERTPKSSSTTSSRNVCFTTMRTSWACSAHPLNWVLDSTTIAIIVVLIGSWRTAA